MLLLSKQDIQNVFSMKEAITATRQAFQIVAEEKFDAPLRTVIPVAEEEGSLLFMPGYVPELQSAALKVVSIFPNNAKKNLPTAPAQVLLLDAKTGIITAMLDGTYITQLRTGAASGAALDALAKKDCETGALIGTGSQSACQLEALLAIRMLKEVRVAGRDYDRTRAFTERMKKELQPEGTAIVPVASGDDAVRDADLIVAVTSSTTPVFDGNLVKKGATVSGVGSYQHHMQELDPVLLSRADKIFFDSEEAVLSESGDILQPLENGTLRKEDFNGDIGHVFSEQTPGRENDDEIIVFKTVGVAPQDLITARAIVEKAEAEGIGTVWEE